MFGSREKTSISVTGPNVVSTRWYMAVMARLETELRQPVDDAHGAIGHLLAGDRRASNKTTPSFSSLASQTAPATRASEDDVQRLCQRLASCGPGRRRFLQVRSRPTYWFKGEWGLDQARRCPFLRVLSVLNSGLTRVIKREGPDVAHFDKEIDGMVDYKYFGPNGMYQDIQVLRCSQAELHEFRVQQVVALSTVGLPVERADMFTILDTIPPVDPTTVFGCVCSTLVSSAHHTTTIISSLAHLFGYERWAVPLDHVKFGENPLLHELASYPLWPGAHQPLFKALHTRKYDFACVGSTSLTADVIFHTN